MAYLAQFLAGIANEIRRGKTLVDLDTARQSSRFLKDEFLRLLPINRIDLDVIKLRCFFAVSEVEIKKSDSPFISKVIDDTMIAIQGKIPKREMPKKPPDETIVRLIRDISLKTVVPELAELDPSDIDKSVDRLSSRFTDNLFGAFKEYAPGASPSLGKKYSSIAGEAFKRSLLDYFKRYKEDLASELFKEISRLQIEVEADKLKGFPPNSLVELELQLIPKTFHWSQKPEMIDKKDVPLEDKYIMMPGS